ncbi:MAG TPA: hypothetical protein VFO77_04905 [Actinoplanes sp.]|nr:hypothetical protein [Actinoplanes sp.]
MLRRLWPGLLAAALFATGACAAESSTEALPNTEGGERMKPLVEQFKQAQSRAKSDFEREALGRAISTGKIDPADYEEAFNRYRRCAQDAGQNETYTKLPNGIYRVTPPGDMAPDAVDAYAETMKECASNAGLVSLEALYRTQVDNPDLLANPKLIVVRCLVKAGLVPADYTEAKLTTFITGDQEGPGDFDPMSAQAQRCLTAGGIAMRIDATPKGGS